jgi:hypothetical protein
MRDSFSRRTFLKQTAVTSLGLGLSGLGALAAPADAPSRTRVSPNDKLTVAVIGTNGRGLAHVECLTNLPGVEIAYICDVDERAVAGGVPLR